MPDYIHGQECFDTARCWQFGHMSKDEDMITGAGELVGVIGLMDDGPPFRLNTVVSYGRSQAYCMSPHPSPSLLVWHGSSLAVF